MVRGQQRYRFGVTSQLDRLLQTCRVGAQVIAVVAAAYLAEELLQPVACRRDLGQSGGDKVILTFFICPSMIQQHLALPLNRYGVARTFISKNSARCMPGNDPHTAGPQPPRPRLRPIAGWGELPACYAWLA